VSSSPASLSGTSLFSFQAVSPSAVKSGSTWDHVILGGVYLPHVSLDLVLSRALAINRV